MSIQVSGTNAFGPVQTTGDGGEAAAVAKGGSAPGLAPADLSKIDDPRLRTLLASGAPLLPEARSEGAIPQGLGTRLEGMAATTDIYSVMALFQKFGQEARNSARAERQVELQTRIDALADAANQMRLAATLRLAAGVASGVAQIGAGVIQIGGGIAGGAAKTDQAARAIAAITDGGAKIAQGIGSTAQSGFEFAAQMTDASKADLDKDATLAQSKYDQANETMQQMRDLIRDVQGKLAEIEQSAHDTRTQILRA